MEVFLIAALLYAGVQQTWKRTDPGGTYSASRAAARSGVTTGARSAKATWNRRRPDRAKKREERRKRWSRSGLPGWVAVQLERGTVGAARLGVDLAAAGVSAGRDGAKAARTEWRTTWRNVHPEPTETGPDHGPDQGTGSGPEPGPVRTGPPDHPAEVEPRAGGRLPIREPEPALVGASALAAAVARSATPRIDHTPSAHPSGIPPEQRCEWCDDAPQETTRGKLKVCSACGSEIDQGTRSAQERFQTPPVTPSPADDRGDPVPDGDYIDSVTGERMTLVEKYRRQGFVIDDDGYIVGHPPEIPDDEKATSHLAQDESGRSTRCGAPWEPWQGPDYRGFRGWMYPRPWRPTKHCSACTDLYRAEERKRKAELESEPEPPRAPDGRCIERVPGMTTIEALTGWGATGEDDLWEKRPVPGWIRCPNRATGPDGLCDEHRTDPPAGTSPAGGTTTSTEGTRMGLREIINQGRDGDGTASSGTRGGVATMTRPAGGEAEVDDLATLKRIAAQVVQQHEDSEFMKIIRMCQTLPEGTDFGNRVGKVLAEFAQACVALGKVGDEVAEMAPSVSAIAEHVRGED